MTLTVQAVTEAMSDLRYDGIEPAYLLVDGTLESSPTETFETGSEDDAWSEDDVDEFMDDDEDEDVDEDVETDGGVDIELEEVRELPNLEIIMSQDALPVDADAVMFGADFQGHRLI